MRRSPWSRLFAAFAATWVAVSLVEPPGLHYCPTHAPGAVVAGGADTQASGHHHHGASAPASERGEQPDSGHGKGCLCLGDCASMFKNTTAPAPSVVVSVVTTPAIALPSIPAHAPVTRGGLVLPFANGPPSRA